MKTISCGIYKTRRGAERYVTRQSALSQQAHGEDITGNYTIQEIFTRETARSGWTRTYRVYYRTAVTA